MYEQFFNFKEKPFKLVPNPAYLFLSKSHEETLAHLNYALAGGDGFVEITGEVGTGKTTLCRAFLENLDANTIAAYIFNPMLGPKQLISTINDELGIKYETDNTKDLIDKLNSFLINKKSQRKKVILLIDEAQNLSRTVLEQLRLLSNLETNKEKLLQIILVGQPELSDLLDSHELRQLRQRITLKYHLVPLTYQETVAYIEYRISIAAKKAGIKFSRAAFLRIYKYSKGIPRVINIVCDRALLTAFGYSRHKITGSIVRTSIKELMGLKVSKRLNFFGWKTALISCSVLVILSVATLFHQPLIRGVTVFFDQFQNPEYKNSTMGESSPTDAMESDSKQPEIIEPDSSGIDDSNESVISDSTAYEASDINVTRDPNPSYDSEPEDLAAKDLTTDSQKRLKLEDHLAVMDIRSSRYSALKNVLELWHTSVDFKPYLDDLDDDQAFFRLTTKPSGLLVYRIETNMTLLKRLDLPALLEFFPPGSEEPGYLTLSKTEGDDISFDDPTGNGVIVTNEEEINLYWSGVAYLPWKNFLSIWGTLPTRTNKDSVITLKMLLHELGYLNVDINDEYDARTRAVIKKIQTEYGILTDGIVGPLTKIILYRLKGSFEMPRLSTE